MSPTVKKVLIAALGVIVAVGVGIGVRTAFAAIGGAQSKSDIVASGVRELKSQTTLPKRIDEVTTLEDITADGGTIHYHYTIDGVDPSQVSKSDLADTVTPNVCSAKDGRKLLDEGVRMRYSYAFEGASDTVSFVVSKADC